MLWTEHVLRIFAPAGLLILAYAALASIGLGNGWILLATSLAALAALVWGISRIQAPSSAEIDRRIEAVSGLRHRPLAALTDAPAAGDTRLWQAHQARMAAMLAGARVGWPAPFAAAGDAFSIRALVFLVLFCGVVIAGPGPLAAGFALPAWPIAPSEVDAWVTPPTYSGQPPVMLGHGPVAVLAGSQISVIETGGAGAIEFQGRKLAGGLMGDNSRRGDGIINASGVLTVGPWWHRLAHWTITAAPPVAPVLTLSPIIARDGALHLTWNAVDPYGMASLSAGLRPVGYPRSLPEAAALPPASGPGAAALDFSASPFAGLPVTVTLHGVNLAGLAASSGGQIVNLPAIPYRDPTAAALRVLRQALALTPEHAPVVAAQLMQVVQHPPSAISYAADAQLAMLAAAMQAQTTGAQGAVTRLLGLMQMIEAGPDYAPAQKLAAADQALLQALAHGPPDAATLSRLLAAMQQALAAHLAAISPAGQPAGAAPNFDPSSLNALAAKIAADEQAGRTAQAQAELQQLAQALHALQNAQAMTPAQAAQAAAAARATQAITQLIQSQAGILDKTGNGTATAGQEGQLQQSLRGLRGQLGKAGIGGLPGLGPAQQNMQQAQTALGQLDQNGAEAAETGAIQNLQKAAAALQKASGQQLSIGQPGQMPQGDGAQGGEDLNSPGLALPGQNPADVIEQEIIRRDADPNLPAATHAYLRRLLSQ